MHVIAAPDHRVPMEDDPRQYIEAAPAEPADVPDSAYYRRRLAAGELLLPGRAQVSAKHTAKANRKGARK
jgi:hypothetical protein